MIPLRFYPQFSSILTGFLSLLFAGVMFTNIHAQDKTMMQGFYWDSTPGGVWYDYLSDKSEELGLAGFNSVWLPPPSRGAAGPWDVGYTPYDYYDLGEFAGPTRYGTRTQLEHAVSQLKSNGLKVYMDIVVNHRSGGTLEPNIYSHYYTNRDGGSLYSPDGIHTYTAFPLPGGSGRISWDVGEGNEFFYPNFNHNPSNTFDFHSDSQLLGFHQMYTNYFAYSNALHTGTGDTLPIGDSLMVWADWLTNTLDLDGYRFDFVKGIHPEYFKRFMKYGAMQGKFHVHEFYDGNMDRIRDYITLVNTGFNHLSPSPPPSSEGAIFDFNLRFAYKEMSDQGDGFDIRTFHGRGLFNQSGVLHEHIATFVENHDFDRLDHEGNISGPGHSPVVNQKVLAYAHMMTHPGYATVWWRDYFYYGLKDQINMMLAIRNELASGGHQILTARGDVFWPGYQPTDERNLYIMQRNGHNDQTGLIFAMNKHQDYDIGAWVTNIRDDWRNRDLYDVTGNVSGVTRVYDDNRVYIQAKKDSWSLFIPVDYEFELPSGVSVSGVEGLYDYYLPGQAVTLSAVMLSEDIQQREATAHVSVTNESDVEVYSADAGFSVNPFQRAEIAFGDFSLDVPGNYTLTISISGAPAGSVPERQFTIEIPDSETGDIKGYAGNSRTEAGSPVGLGALLLTDDGDNLQVTFNKGAGDFDGMLVLYLQTGAPGRAQIDANVNDVSDLHRRAISSAGTGAANIHFPAGFEASHAIAMNRDFAGLWQIPAAGTVGNGGLNFLGDIAHPQSGEGNTLMLEVDKTLLFSGEENELGFVGLYLDTSDMSPWPEAFGYGLQGSRGASEPVRFTGYHTYPQGGSRFPAMVEGGEGWRIFSVPVNGFTIEDLAEMNLVQGVDGSYPDAQVNVFLHYNGLAEDFSNGRNAGWLGAESLNQPLLPGQAFLWYLYDNDAVAESRPLPFVLAAAGHGIGDEYIEIPLHADGNRFNLIGNPFGDALNTQNITAWATGGTVQNVVHLWDNQTEGGTWVTASLSNSDRMAVWQGAMIENNDAGAIRIPRDARSQGGALFQAGEFAQVGFNLEVTDGKITRTDRNVSLYFHAEADTGWDVYDASKPAPLSAAYVAMGLKGNRDGKPVLQSQYSLPMEPGRTVEIPVDIQTSNIDGDYTLTWPVWREVPESIKILLVDTETGSVTDLRETAAYHFRNSGVKMQSRQAETRPGAALKASGDNRFLLRIKDTSSGGETEPDLPEVISLSQNYPNPFNPVTQINYDLPESADVRLEVYNIQGQRVATLVNAAQSAGSHNITFDAGKLASGVYLYRLQVSNSSGTAVFTRKMTLVK